MMRILVTGANGFIGQALVRHLSEAGQEVRAVSRQPVAFASETHLIDDLITADWAELLIGIDQVVHLAARVHQVQETSPQPLTEFRRLNRDVTAKLAEAATQAGVKRFVFISSVKAAIDQTGLQPVDETLLENPQSDYGISKREAEQELLKVERNTGFEPVILRLPLIYGPAVKGNLLSLFRLMKTGIPLPLRAIDNRRSLLGLDNLLQAIDLALATPAIVGEIFYLEDTTLSTPALLSAVARALHRPARLWAIPPNWLKLLARLTGQTKKFERLCESLAVSSEKFRQATGWQPAIPMALELEKIAATLYPLKAQ